MNCLSGGRVFFQWNPIFVAEVVPVVEEIVYGRTFAVSDFVTISREPVDNMIFNIVFPCAFATFSTGFRCFDLFA